MIPEPMEIRTRQGIFILTCENCCVCCFPESFKKYEHVFLSQMDGSRVYIFDPKLVKKVRLEGFPLYWRPYPTENDREAYRQRSLNLRELTEFLGQLEDGVNWEELLDE